MRMMTLWFKSLLTEACWAEECVRICVVLSVEMSFFPIDLHLDDMMYIAVL